MTVRIVALDGSSDSPTLIDSKVYTSGANEELALSLADLARDLRTVVDTQKPDAVVVQRISGAAGKKEVWYRHGLASGVCVAVAKELHVPSVELLTAQQVAGRCGGTRSEAEERGKALTDAGLSAAAAAAIAAL